MNTRSVARQIRKTIRIPVNRPSARKASGEKAKKSAPERFQIDVFIGQRITGITQRVLLEAAIVALKLEGVHSGALSIAVLKDEVIQELNRVHLGHDYPTDVLSFLFEQREPLNGKRTMNPGTSGPKRTRVWHLDGEVLIGAEVAIREAARFGHTVSDEILLYLVHGVLHLIGYDDVSPTEKRLMRRREHVILKKLGTTPNYRAHT